MQPKYGMNHDFTMIDTNYFPPAMMVLNTRTTIYEVAKLSPAVRSSFDKLAEFSSTCSLPHIIWDSYMEDVVLFVNGPSKEPIRLSYEEVAELVESMERPKGGGVAGIFAALVLAAGMVAVGSQISNKLTTRVEMVKLKQQKA